MKVYVYAVLVVLLALIGGVFGGFDSREQLALGLAFSIIGPMGFSMLLVFALEDEQKARKAAAIKGVR